MSSRNRASSRCWSISGRRGAGRASSSQPALEKVVAAAGGEVKLVKMNIDDHPAIAGQLGIQSIPAVIAFKNGQPVDGFMGAIPESQIRDFIERLVGKKARQPQIAEALAAASEAREAGDLQAAADFYDAVLAGSAGQCRRDRRTGRPAVRKRRCRAPRNCLPERPPTSRTPRRLPRCAPRSRWPREAAKLGDPAELERGSPRPREIIRRASTSP